MDDLRARFLRDRVMTATPAQRIVMLYDRLVVDVRQAREAGDAAAAAPHLSHATSIVAELQGSLDITAGGPAQNLASIHSYLIGTLLQARLTGRLDELATVATIVSNLRDTWARVANGTTDSSPGPADAGPATPDQATLAWVG